MQFIANFQPPMTGMIKMKAAGSDHAVIRRPRNRPTDAGLLLENFVRPLDNGAHLGSIRLALEVNQILVNSRMRHDIQPVLQVSLDNPPQPQPFGFQYRRRPKIKGHSVRPRL